MTAFDYERVRSMVPSAKPDRQEERATNQKSSEHSHKHGKARDSAGKDHALSHGQPTVNTQPDADGSTHVSGTGSPLGTSTRLEMERLFQHDFSSVRIHSDDITDKSAQMRSSQAFTSGHNVVFSAGRFEPSTQRGRTLLAHELTHVVQSDIARTSLSTPAATVSVLEQEAESVARAVHSGATLPSIRGAARGLAAPLRQPESPPTFGNLPLDKPQKAGARRVQLSSVDGKWTEFASGRSNPSRTAKGSYDFVVINGEIWAVRSSSRFGHTEAAGGGRVTWAGTIHITQSGKLKFWTNASGHYLPAGGFSTNANLVHPDLKSENFQQTHRGPALQGGGKRRGPSLPTIRDQPTKIDTPPQGTRQQPPASPSSVVTASPPALPQATSTSSTPPAASPPKAPSSATSPAGKNPSGNTARVGMPDRSTVHVGGPSARGRAAGGGVVVGAQLKDWIMGKLGERMQEKRLEAALETKLTIVAQRQQTHPELGVLVTIYWRVYRGNEGETSRRFEDISLKYGTTQKEARESRLSTALNVSGDPKDTETDEQWIEPLEPLPLAELPTPQRKIAIATLGPGRVRMQGVAWGGKSGFDQHDRRSASTTVAMDVQPRVGILMPPESITFRNGKLRHTVSIGIEKRLTADQYLIPVVNDLDAALVAPLDDVAAGILSKGKAIKDTLGQLGDDYGVTRWVNPADLRIIEILDAGQVARRPPTVQEKFDERIRFLPVNTGELLKRMGEGVGKKLRLTPNALERFADIVPFDLTQEELALLGKHLAPVGRRNIDQVLDHLEQAIKRLPSRGEQSEADSNATGDDIRAIRQKLSATDWSVAMDYGGLFFRDKGPIGLAEGTKTKSFAYGVDAAGNRFGGIVEIKVGRASKDSTPVTVLSSTRLLTPDGRLYTPHSPLVGQTFNIRKLGTLAKARKHSAAGSRETR